jgi:hypothetical protein
MGALGAFGAGVFECETKARGCIVRCKTFLWESVMDEPLSENRDQECCVSRTWSLSA